MTVQVRPMAISDQPSTSTYTASTCASMLPSCFLSYLFHLALGFQLERVWLLRISGCDHLEFGLVSDLLPAPFPRRSDERVQWAPSTAFTRASPGQLWGRDSKCRRH